MKVKIKRTHPEAKLPEYMTDGAAGMDVYAISCETKQLPTGPIVEYDIGVSIQPPSGYGVFLLPRSSITSKTTLMLGNSLGLGDSDYTGSYKVQFRLVPGMGLNKKYEVGDRIGQIFILPIPKVEWEVVEELDKTERGEGRHGSTGSK